MTCGHCCATDQKFNRAVAARDRERYRQHGPDPTTVMIIDLVGGPNPEGATLLDIGGGIGVIAHELLARNVVTSALLVEAASAYLETARSEAHDRGTDARLRLLQGDFVDVAGEAPAADIVTLDRVVCCYPDYRALLGVAAAKCRTVLAVSYPRDRWYVRFLFGLQNLARRMTKDTFRTYVHAPVELRRVLVDAGFTLSQQHRTMAWAVDSYVRTS